MEYNVDNGKVFNHLKNVVVPNMDKLSDKELILSIMATSHLENVNNFKLGFSGSVMGGSMLGGIMASTSLLGVFGFLAVGTVATAVAVSGDLKRKQIKEMENKLTDYLLNRFDDAKVAYDTVAKMIVNVTREEIVEYLENASK